MEPDGKDGLVSYTKFVELVEGVEEMLQELKQQTFAKYDAFTIAELFNEQKDVKEYIGAEGCFSTIFDFGPHLLTLGEHGWYDAKPVDFKEWRKTIFEGQLKCGDNASGTAIFVPGAGNRHGELPNGIGRGI